MVRTLDSLIASIKYSETGGKKMSHETANKCIEENKKDRRSLIDEYFHMNGVAWAFDNEED